MRRDRPGGGRPSTRLTMQTRGDDRPGGGPGRPARDAALAGLLLAGALLLAYGPAKLAGHSIYGGVIQDVTNLYGFYCWDEFSRAEFAAGRFPLWNPHNAFGVPHLANVQTAIFFPLNWIKFGLGFWPTIDAILLLRLWIGGMGAWLLARRALKAGFWPALLGGLAFMLSGHLTRYVYMSHLNVEVLLPWALVAAWALSARVALARLLALGAVFALLVLGGFPEATLWAAGLAAAYYLFLSYVRPGGPGTAARGAGARAAALAAPLLVLAAAGGLGLLASLASWVPFAEYLPQAWTYHDPQSGLRHADPRLAIALILPWIFGENDLSPVAVFLPPSLGLVPVVLALAAAGTISRARASAGFFLAAAAVAGGTIYGLPPFNLLGRIFPFSLTYNDKYAAPALALAVAMLAALGAEDAARGRGARRLAGAATAVALWIGASIWAGYENLFAPVWALGLKFSPGSVAMGLGLAGAVGTMALLRRRGWMGPRWLAAALFGLCLVGLVFDLGGQRPRYHDRLDEGPGAFAQSMAQGRGRVRVHADPELEELSPNRLLPSRVDDARLYEPLYPRSYVEYLGELNGLSDDERLEHYQRHMFFAIEPERLADPYVDLANIGYLVLSHPLEELPLARRWAREAVTLSPRRESWLRAERLEAGGSIRLALLEHAPARIEGPVPQAPGQTASLRFELAEPDNQLSGAGPAGDGVFALVTGGGRLRFARYLDAKARLAERGWRPCSIGLGSAETVVLALFPGPRGDATRDAVAFGSVSIVVPQNPTGFQRVGDASSRSYVYFNQEAYPREFVVGAAGPVKKDDDYMKATRAMVERTPSILRSIALVRGVAPMAEAGDAAGVKSTGVTRVADDPGRILIDLALDRSGYLVVTEQKLPGFRAFLDRAGRRTEARIATADGPFMAIAAPAGKSRLELRYQPAGFRLGLFVALSTLAGVVPPLFARGRSRRRPGAEVSVEKQGVQG